MKITDIKLNEAIIKVPPVLMNAISKIQGSVLLTICNNEMNKAKESGNNYRAEALDRAMGMIQKKFSSVQLLNDSSFNNIYNKIVNVEFSRQQFVQELSSFKMNAEQEYRVQEVIDNLSLGLRVFGLERNNNQHGYVQRKGNNGMIICLGVSMNMENPEHDVMNALGILNHETQHIIQLTVLNVIEGSDGKHNKITAVDKDLEGKESQESYENYVSSFVEYGPHISDFCNNFARTCELLKMKNVIKDKSELSSSEYQQLMTHLIRISLKSDKSMVTFFSTLQKRSPELYKKAWKTVYKKIEPIFNTISTEDIKYSYVDVSALDIDANMNVMSTVLDMLQEKSDVVIQGYRGPNTMNIDVLGFSVLDVKCKIFDKGDIYNVVLDYASESEDIDVDSKALLAWIDDFEMLTQPGEVFDSLQVISYTSHPDTSPDVVDSIMSSCTEIVGDSGEVTGAGGKFEVVLPDITLNIEMSDNAKYLRITSPQYNYVRYNVSTLQLYSFFLHFMANYREDKDKTLQAMKVSATFMDVMLRLDGYIKD